MKKLLLPILSLVLLLTACYDKDIQEINDRLDNIENQKIATLSEQIEAINKTIPLLSEVDEQLSEHILSVEETSNKEIASLKDVNTSLKNQIAELEKYVNEQLSKTTDWVNGTFATLEQYKAVTEQLEKIKTQVDNIKPELLDVISKSEETLKTWVSEQLTDYYKIAEIDAKLESIDKKIKEGDEENAKALKELKEQLEKDKTEITEAYQKAIKEAIETNNGEIDKKISKEIEAVNKRIDEEVKAINTKISDLEARIKAIEDKLDEILGRKLDITFDVDCNIVVAPNYTFEIGYSVTSSTNSAIIEVTSSADIKAKVVTNGLNGKISITTGNAIDEYSKVIVFVSNGENVIMRSITFEQATVQINNSDTKTIPVEGGTVELSFLTNVECEVVIPSSASSWLTVAPTTMALEQRTVTLQATANEGTNRSAVVTVKSVEGNLAVQYTINQESNITILNYTTNDGKPLDPLTTEGFGAELAENSYDAATGKGYLKFNGKIDTIPANAFVACTKLTWIEIPDCIKTIGDSAFRGCSAIEEITIPSSVKSIGTSSFEGCGGKATINCEIQGVTNYKDGNFYNAKFSEVTISNGVTEIGSYAFSHCNNLTNISIPDSVTKIGGSAFYNCSVLKVASIPSQLPYIAAEAFYGCSSLKKITIPDSVKWIGVRAFYNCNSLTSISIGNGVNNISDEAFYNCKSLNSVHISDLSAWCKICFNHSTANPLHYAKNLYLNGELVSDLTISDSNIEIGEYVFSNCTSLTSVTIGDGIISISSYAFSNCSSLSSVTIGNRVSTIGEYAFYGCSSLKGFFGKFASDDNRCLIVNGVLNAFIPANEREYTIPYGVSRIGSSVFRGCSTLESVTIPNSVSEIGEYAFSDCSSLTSVTIPNSVTSIESYAFYLCSNLKDVIIGTGIKKIGREAFYRYSSGSYSSNGDVNQECNCQTPCLKVYLKATNPPILFDHHTFFGGSMTHKTFYVPTESVEAYKAAEYWNYDYADRIVGYDFQ